MKKEKIRAAKIKQRAEKREKYRADRRAKAIAKAAAAAKTEMTDEEPKQQRIGRKIKFLSWFKEKSKNYLFFIVFKMIPSNLNLYFIL